jgi:hypothetical protein
MHSGSAARPGAVARFVHTLEQKAAATIIQKRFDHFRILRGRQMPSPIAN